MSIEVLEVRAVYKICKYLISRCISWFCFLIKKSHTIIGFQKRSAIDSARNPGSLGNRLRIVFCLFV